MLDVHAPEHPIASYRDFLIHLLTITVGLLIALGLENLAEAAHHFHIRHEAEVNIRQELAHNRERVLGNAPTLQAEQANLAAWVLYLEALSEKQQAPALPAPPTFVEEPIPDAAWHTAASTGALAYMDYGQVELFSGAYKEQSLLESAEEQALEDYFQFKPVLKRGALSPAQAAAVLIVVQRAVGHLRGMEAFGQGTLGSYEQALK